MVLHFLNHQKVAAPYYHPNSRTFSLATAIQYAVTIADSKFVIITDSLLALQAVKARSTYKNEIIGNIVNDLYLYPSNVIFLRVPGHINIVDKEKADALERSATALREAEKKKKNPWELM